MRDQQWLTGLMTTSRAIGIARKFVDVIVLTVSLAMTLQEAKSIARHLGLTLRLLHSGKYRVNFRDGNETTAYYTDDLEDAVNTAVEMAHKRTL